MTVADLLAASRASHAIYRQAVAKKSDPDVARGHLRDALSARQRADQIDSEHRHPAWQADPAPHAELVAFYEKVLSR